MAKNQTQQEVPAIVQASMEGGLRMGRAFYRDYTQCLKDKAIANRACETWEETVERAMQLAAMYGAHVAEMTRIGLEVPEAGQRAVWGDSDV